MTNFFPMGVRGCLGVLLIWLGSYSSLAQSISVTASRTEVVTCSGSNDAVVLAATVSNIPTAERLSDLVWYDETNTEVGRGLTLTVTPTASRTYTARLDHSAGVELASNGHFNQAPFSPGNGIATQLQTTTWNGAGTFAWNQALPSPPFNVIYDYDTGSGFLYLFVNGFDSPDRIVWEQASVSITPGKRYALSAHVATLYDSSPAQLQFFVNGSQIGNVFSAPASGSQGWQQFYNFWTAPAGVSVATITIKNQNTDASGNDFGIDRISFAEVRTASAAVPVQVASMTAPGTTLTQPPTCSMPTGTVSVSSAGATAYSVDGGAFGSSPTFTGLSAGTHSVVARAANGCLSPAVSFVIPSQPITPAAPVLSPASPTICGGSSLVLSAGGCGGLVTWSSGQTGVSATVSPVATTTYTANCAENGCLSSDAVVVVRVRPNPDPPVLHSITVCQGQALVLTPFGCSGTLDLVNSYTIVNTIPYTTTLVSYSLVCQENGCQSPVSDGTVMGIETPQKPLVTVSNSEICEGQPLTLEVANCVGGLLQWSPANGGNSMTYYPTFTQAPVTVQCFRAGCAGPLQTIRIKAAE